MLSQLRYLAHLTITLLLGFSNSSHIVGDPYHGLQIHLILLLTISYLVLYFIFVVSVLCELRWFNHI